MNFFLLLFALPALADPSLDFHGYLRAGTGSNGRGAKQECFYNQGTPGNEFRLGNECSIYGEAAALANFLPKGQNPFFRTQLRFAFFPSGHSSFEDNDTDGRDINIVEAFAEAGGLNGSPLTYWAGKRFYRDVDLYIYDWYYFAQMNGNGAGVGNIPLGSGFFSAAILLETGATRTDIGVNQNQVIDLRWQEVAFGEKNRLHFWGAFGEAPGGIAGTTNYQKRHGWLGGVRWRRTLENGFNDATIVHGQNLLEAMNLYGDSSLPKTPAGPPPARRWRFVEHLAFKPHPKLGLFAGAALELWDPATAGTDARGSWWSLGARPTYFFTDQYQLAFEAGHSVIRDRSERNSDNSFVGKRSLTRLTIAPQLAIGPGLWDRPVLRAYYGRSFWNDANKSRVASGAPSVAGKNWGEVLGVQAELWF